MDDVEDREIGGAGRGRDVDGETEMEGFEMGGHGVEGEEVIGEG